MPIGTRLLSLCLALCPLDAARSQGPVVDPQLLLDLSNEERSVDAVRKLVQLGGPAVDALMAAMRDAHFRASPRRLATAIYVLGKLGDTAAPAAPLLLEELATAVGNVRRNLYWALGELGPKADGGQGKVLEALLACKPEPGPDHQEWVFACRRIQLGTDVTPEQLAKLLQQQEHAQLVAASSALCRLPPGAPLPREELLAAWTRLHSNWRAYGDNCLRATLEVARAVVLYAPDAPEAVSARAALIYHFDADVRLQAVMQLGQTRGTEAEAAVEALQASLTDGSVVVRREAVTALQMLGPAAAAARPALARLADDPDAQIRARVAAALRAIGERRK